MAWYGDLHGNIVGFGTNRNGKVPLLTAPVGAIFSMERSTSRRSQ